MYVNDQRVIGTLRIITNMDDNNGDMAELMLPVTVTWKDGGFMVEGNVSDLQDPIFYPNPEEGDGVYTVQDTDYLVLYVD